MMLSDCKEADEPFRIFGDRLMRECLPIISRYTIAFFDEQNGKHPVRVGRPPEGRHP